MGALVLSYQQLPPSLQRCFAFCSLFPKGHPFKHDHLVNLWIAEGFIETEDSNEHMKDIAGRYILELISSSFFQVDESYHYYMHDLIHDLAQDVSEGEYFRIESGEKKEIPAHTRHIFCVDHMLGEYVEKICKLKDLRTIIVSFSYSNVILKEADLNTLFTELRKLYVVEVGGYNVKKIPKSVVQLKNLRYLNFGTVEEDEISASLNKLYQLRTLCIDREIPDVGRLTLLQELKKFHVKLKSGFELKQLDQLNDLYGSLSIYGVEDVNSKAEAEQAKLYDKKGLNELRFCWNYKGVLRDNDVEVLDGFRPPSQIKRVNIEGYSGKRFPCWILENNDSITDLEYLELSRCEGLEALNRITELSDLLYLTIYFLPRIRCWVPLPSKVTHLQISHCLSIAFVLKEDLEMIMSTKDIQISQIVTSVENFRSKGGHFSVHYQFKHVQKMMNLGAHIEEEALLDISNDLNKCLDKRLDIICQLKDVYDKPFLPPSLDRLSIESCFITDKILARSLQGVTSLTLLILVDIITITCIPKEVINSLTKLLNLNIKGCMFLTSIGGLDTHSTLEKLEISYCPNLTFETSLVVASNSDTVELTSSSCQRKTRSSIVKDVTLWSCIPSDDLLQGLVSLEHLNVRDCPTIVNPHLGHSKALNVLQLVDCPNLASLRGLSELNNLKRLMVLSGCDKLACSPDADKLPQLEELRISRWSLLEQLVSRDGFSSLVSLQLVGSQQEYFSHEECEEFRHLISLREISFRYCKIHSLPNLQCLDSLRYLNIYNCKNLISLSDLPPSMQCIGIDHCDEEFTRSCKNPNHSNGQKISHIPNKSIV